MLSNFGWLFCRLHFNSMAIGYIVLILYMNFVCWRSRRRQQQQKLLVSFRFNVSNSVTKSSKLTSDIHRFSRPLIPFNRHSIHLCGYLFGRNLISTYYVAVHAIRTESRQQQKRENSDVKSCNRITKHKDGAEPELFRWIKCTFSNKIKIIKMNEYLFSSSHIQVKYRDEIW